MRLLVFICLFFSLGTAQAQSETLTLKKLIDQFNSVVFIHEHGKQGREPKPIIKWEKPIVYSPSGTLTRDQVKKFFDLMSRIKRLTKLDMRMAQRGEKANLIINFLPKKALAKKTKPGINCFGNIKVDKKTYRINGAKAYIPSDRPDKTDHCLIEETVQLFGLTNDSTVLKNSMFYEHSKRTSLSVSDQILLKALYDPRFKSGMKKDEAQGVVRTVISEIVKKASKKKK
ncbi:exported hypothetical protein [Candidatus Terasakiella magnetica]|uniref:DUF2927 domain-containing protein n=1 Tax=Candidatus Terasakiella magnetica TaxID=1867952 RepID=A0A1C3RHS6_9PROT|nr:DUF2927 domain-containing protein [Candidatus Terasakiella magnetica]SCA56829.1 exported hypothetical protein [Candidatus Terasakiella magnetica]